MHAALEAAVKVAFTTTAGEDLGLDHEVGGFYRGDVRSRPLNTHTPRTALTERLGDLFSLGGRERGLGHGRGDAIRVEQLNGLVLVDGEVSLLLPVGSLRELQRVVSACKREKRTLSAVLDALIVRENMMRGARQDEAGTN